MSACPAKRKNCAGLRFTSLERDSVPSERLAEHDKSPAVRTFIQEDRFPLSDTAYVQPMLRQFIRERLLDVGNHVKDLRFVLAETIQDIRNVFRLLHRAVEVGGKPPNAVRSAHAPNSHQSVIIPLQF